MYIFKGFWLICYTSLNMQHRDTVASATINVSSEDASKSKRASVATLEGKSRFPGGQQRKWLHLDAKGSLTCVAADKHTLVTTLGIPLRDLRILDPLVRHSVWALLFLRCAHRAMETGGTTTYESIEDLSIQ